MYSAFARSCDDDKTYAHCYVPNVLELIRRHAKGGKLTSLHKCPYTLEDTTILVTLGEDIFDMPVQIVLVFLALFRITCCRFAFG